MILIALWSVSSTSSENDKARFINHHACTFLLSSRVGNDITPIQPLCRRT